MKSAVDETSLPCNNTTITNPGSDAVRNTQRNLPVRNSRVAPASHEPCGGFGSAKSLGFPTRFEALCPLGVEHRVDQNAGGCLRAQHAGETRLDPGTSCRKT